MDDPERVAEAMARAKGQPAGWNSGDIEVLAAEVKRLEAIVEQMDDAVYNTFAYRLGPDHWEEAQQEYKAEPADPGGAK